MLFLIPPKRPHRKVIELPAAQVPPANPLVLTACDWEPAVSITLTFDRAIDVTGMDGSQIQIVDGTGTGYLYQATGSVDVVGGTTIVIGLDIIEDSFGAGPLLDASPTNGIVASDDGAAWAGVENAPIPL